MSLVTNHPHAGALGGDWAIDLTNVSKMYKGRVHALRGIEMRVRRGEIFGLLGPNGAGKSTLVKILMTVISPTKATGTLLDHPVGHKATLGRVGYLPEHHRFPDYLTGRQVLEFYGAMGGVGRAERRKRSNELLEMVDMTKWAGTRVRGYSKGMRQRVGIAQALMNKPELVVLDEPTDGVDPVGRRDIRNILTRLRDSGMTVFLNSHLLSELEMVCDRVAILVQGKVVSQGTIDELTVHRKFYDIEIAGSDPREIARTFAAALPGNVDQAALTHSESGVPALTSNGPVQVHFGRMATGEPVVLSNTMLRVATSDPQVVQPLLDALRDRGAVIKTVRAFRPSLEDLFMEAVTDPTTGQALAPGAASGKETRR